MTLKHFDDLTAIDCPFGELDADTIGRLVRASMDRRALDLSCGSEVWARLASAPAWDADTCYRLAPKPLTKPSIDWTAVGSMWNAMATDKDGTTWMGTFKLKMHDSEWYGGDDHLPATNYASFVPGTCDWYDSLVMRPGYEGE